MTAHIHEVLLQHPALHSSNGDSGTFQMFP